MGGQAGEMGGLRGHHDICIHILMREVGAAGRFGGPGVDEATPLCGIVGSGYVITHEDWSVVLVVIRSTFTVESDRVITDAVVCLRG